MTSKQQRLKDSADLFLERRGYCKNGLRETGPGTQAVGAKKMRLNQQATELHKAYVATGADHLMSFAEFKRRAA
jgi:hypothetical protein